MWIKFFHNFTLIKKRYGPFLWMGFNYLKATEPTTIQFTFYNSVPRSSWYLFNWPRKDERLSWPRSHPLVLNAGPLDWKSSALTARPFPNNHFLKNWNISYGNIIHMDSLHLKFTKIWQTFTHTKESQKTRCFLYTVILIFTSNHICTLQRYMKS